MKININSSKLFNTWNGPINKLIESNYFNGLLNFLKKNYKYLNICPEQKNVFKAFELTDYNNLKVVILGKDPYSDGKSATGLAFANEDKGGVISPSLVKIKECIETTIYNGLNLDFNPNLESWAEQGVLLLNTALTVEKDKIGSHEIYWKEFTKTVIETINDNHSGIIFMLWGKDAQAFDILINKKKHYVLKDRHPAYADYNNIAWNCNHFTEANKLIEENNGKEFCIKW